MFLIEPNRTQFDLSFRLFGIPVRVHPLFWVFTAFMGSNLGDPKRVLMWVLAAFVAILIHELGHALVVIHFGWRPWITLYGMGGLASYQPTHHDSRKQIMISFAGPGAGFLLALFVVCCFDLLEGQVWFHMGWPYLVSVGVWSDRLPVLVNFWANDVLQLSVYWGLLNLLPIIPLDGGKICQELLRLYGRGNTTALAYQISMVMAGLMAVYFIIYLDNKFTAMFFAMMAFQSYQMLIHLGGRGGGGYDRW